MSDESTWDPPDPAIEPVMVGSGRDPGLTSRADLRALTRLLMWGLVAGVVVGIVAVGLGGNLATVLLVVVTYAAVAATQWVAAFRRARERRFT